MRKYLSDTFRYNDTANRQVLNLIKELPEKKAAIRFFGHLISCQNKWMARLTQDPNETEMTWWTPAYALDELEIEWNDSLQRWLAYLDSKTDEELFSEISLRGMDGNQYITTPGDIALQLNYHSIHHRAQLQAIIREQGLEPEFVDYIGLKFRRADSIENYEL